MKYQVFRTCFEIWVHFTSSKFKICLDLLNKSKVATLHWRGNVESKTEFMKINWCEILIFSCTTDLINLHGYFCHFSNQFGKITEFPGAELKDKTKTVWEVEGLAKDEEIGMVKEGICEGIGERGNEKIMQERKWYQEEETASLLIYFWSSQNQAIYWNWELPQHICHIVLSLAQIHGISHLFPHTYVNFPCIWEEEETPSKKKYSSFISYPLPIYGGPHVCWVEMCDEILCSFFLSFRLSPSWNEIL